MNTLFKSVAVAALMLGAAIVQPALAQTTPASQIGGTVIPGLAIANLDAVIASSSAYRTGEQQRVVTYKAQLDAAEARRNQLEAQLKPLVDKFEKDRAVAAPNQQALQLQAATIQQLQAKGQQELQNLVAPVALSRAYVNEQIEDRLDQAIKNAMAKKKISLLISPEAVLATNNAYNLNPDILNELNLLVPAAQLVPPTGWEPRQVREARAQQAAAAGPAPAAPSNPTTGR